MGKRIIICGGGTAGHIYPAIAIIEEVLSLQAGAEILYVGTRKGMEQRIITNSGIKFEHIRAAGILQKGGFVKKLKSYAGFVLSLAGGLLKSISIIKNFNPDCILAMGGYVCAPVLAASILLRKKYFLHEQNYIPGRLNKVFSKRCSKIFISFNDTEKYFDIQKSKIVFSGNPVRKIIREAKSLKKKYLKYGLKEDRFTITAFGGSLGSQNINNVFLQSAEKLGSKFPHLQFLLISGARFYEEAKLEKSYSDFIKILSYSNEMDEIYNISDLIVSRAGANTIAEIMILNIPSVLIPYPYAINNHQYYNALVLEKEKRALLVDDKALSEEVLYNILKKLISNDYYLYNQLKKTESCETIKSHKIIADYLCS